MARLSLTSLSAALWAAAAAPAAAGEIACRFEAGVVVVPAEVAGIGGDYILDTGTAQSALHQTRAETEGIVGTDLSGEVRLAGQSVATLPLKVVDLDVRTWNRDALDDHYFVQNLIENFQKRIFITIILETTLILTMKSILKN